MKTRVVSAVLITLVILAAASLTGKLDAMEPFSRQELVQSWDDLGRELEGIFGRWRDYFLPTASREDRALISMMLRNREKLGLSTDQVKKLEQLRSEFQKDSIRRDADLRVAEMDLTSLLDAQPVDMPKVEAKIREIEKLRADARIARIRAMERGKEQLTADQRKKLQDLLAEPRLTRLLPQVDR